MYTPGCTPCCTDPQVTEVPGPEGDAGQDGSDGQNAFTALTAPFTIPAVGVEGTASVTNSDWVSYGQFVTIGDTDTSAGPATFQVTGIPSSTSLKLTFKGYPADEVATTILPTGSTVSPAGEWGLPTPLTAYGAGTAYSLTATPALINFGTTPLSLILTAPGNYMIFARVRLDYNAATFAAVRTATLKLRRTNNTAADLTNGSTAVKTDIITTLTYSLAVVALPPVYYTTTNSNDTIQVFGDVSVVPSAGSLDAVQGEIVAVRIS